MKRLAVCFSLMVELVKFSFCNVAYVNALKDFAVHVAYCLLVVLALVVLLNAIAMFLYTFKTD